FALEKERTEKDTQRIINGEIATSPLHQHFTYVQRSIYTPQIKRWLGYFSKDQMLVLQSESFFASPGQALEEIGDFLDIPITMPSQFEIHNETKYEKLKSPYLDALMPTWLEDQTNLQALFPHLRGWFHHQ
ncbi:sulfotransferase domain-containing protein, partial [Limnospira sp. PMC 1298.21]|uniref:sulfotransferase domain-containing protein n=2 Tax=unclassified Limnospira TaxID=2642885 RepID=UPI0028E0E7FC